jgi:putative endonuclease
MPGLYLYIARCSDDSLYTGETNDLEIRDWLHNCGDEKKSYTYSRRPVNIVFSDHFRDPSQAILIEKQVKGWSRGKKEALIRGDFELIKECARCKNETSHENYSK